MNLFQHPKWNIHNCILNKKVNWLFYHTLWRKNQKVLICLTDTYFLIHRAIGEEILLIGNTTLPPTISKK